MQHQNWIAQARAHWQEHQPRKFARLMKSGALTQALTQAAEATAQAMQALTQAAEATAQAMQVLTGQGATQEEAWEQVREQYLFPPEEPEQAQKMPRSQGYLAHRELMLGLGSLGMDDEDGRMTGSPPKVD